MFIFYQWQWRVLELRDVDADPRAFQRPTRGDCPFVQAYYVISLNAGNSIQSHDDTRLLETQPINYSIKINVITNLTRAPES